MPRVLHALLLSRLYVMFENTIHHFRAYKVCLRKLQDCPWGWKWRSSYWFVMFVVWLGIVVDMLTFSSFILVVHFHLKELGYTHAVSLTGWLVFAVGVGEIIASLLIAMWSEAHDTRKSPYVAGIFIAIMSQVMFSCSWRLRRTGSWLLHGVFMA
ncbi:hypothetical protein EDD18DRAFT_1175836 [Armillaria luteobubalina]|uniref:Uncharacterized protein n=1 Tax=Armillaria luteobubalina TaxID=153913 RepID=A0AA39URG9_9AGAR|nr:hypothetical protein EDD18DRAFT_1175836 [Armillaria luteobubalina]